MALYVVTNISKNHVCLQGRRESGLGVGLLCKRRLDSGKTWWRCGSRAQKWVTSKKGLKMECGGNLQRRPYEDRGRVKPNGTAGRKARGAVVSGRSVVKWWVGRGRDLEGSPSIW